MVHLRWEIEQTFTFRRGSYLATGKGIPVSLTKITHADVWIEPSQVSYRTEMVSLTRNEQLAVLKREFVLTSNHAVIQDYDCRPIGSKQPLGVCFIRVIPTFGDSRVWNINLLQFPTDSFWTRSLSTGKLPLSCDGIPVRNDGFKTIYQNFGKTPSDRLSPAIKNSLSCSAEYTANRLSAMTIENGFGSVPLRSYRNIQWRDGGIVGFEYSEESTQAKRLIIPTLGMKAKLIAKNNQPCPIIFQNGAMVMDYRLCKPVPLNDFPDRSCPPKAYKFEATLKAASALKSTQEAAFSTEETKINHAPIWLYFAIAVAALLGLAALVSGRVKAARFKNQGLSKRR